MFRFKQTGLALLSSMLVAAVMALIITLSIRGYRLYEKGMEVKAIALDVQRIRQIAETYYSTTGCAWESGKTGVSYFAGEAEPSWEKVSSVIGQTVNFSAGRDPWVSAYSIKVNRESQADDDGGEHAQYHLLVEAKLKDLSKAELAYLRKKLHASAIDSGARQLTWDRLAFVSRGGEKRAYRPLFVNRLGESQRIDKVGELQASRQYCR